MSQLERYKRNIDPNPYKLDRFIEAYKDHLEIALKDLNSKQKTKHWIWYFFPEPEKKLHENATGTTREYSIKNDDEAMMFLRYTKDDISIRNTYIEVIKLSISAISRYGYFYFKNPEDIRKMNNNVIYFLTITVDYDLPVHDLLEKLHKELDPLFERYKKDHPNIS